MGGIHRVKKRLANPAGKRVMMVDTTVFFEKCKIFIVHPDQAVAQATAKRFPDFVRRVVARSSCINLNDFYTAHFEILRKMGAEEQII